MKFWEFPEELRDVLIEGCLHGHGHVTGTIAGTFGDIYVLDQGEHSHPRYLVAKTPKIASSDDPGAIQNKIQQLLYELNQTFKYSNHPLISRFIDIYICFGAPFVLSVKRDRTLLDVITDCPLALTEAVCIGIQITHALEYCAERGLGAHQDLKPANVFADSIESHFRFPSDYPLEWRIMVADFGIADTFKEFGRTSGSRPYMAPEQHAHANDLSKADVFAIGVILHELISNGIHPIGEITRDVWPEPLPEKGNKWRREDIWKKWAKKESKLIDASVVGADSQLAVEILRCLEPDPALRHSLSSLKRGLLQWLEARNDAAFSNLSVLLRYFDSVAAESEEGGWPYYEERLRDVNAGEW